MSVLHYTIALLSAAFLLIYLYTKWLFKYWERHKVFQVNPSIPLGNIGLRSKKHISLILADFYKEIKCNNQDFGGIYITTKQAFIPTSPEIIKEILVKKFSKFNSRGFYCNDKGNPLSAHLFSLPFNRWKPLRTKLNPAFSSAKLRSMVNAITECSKPLIDLVQQKAINKGLFDAQDYFKRYTLDVIGCTVLGIDVNSFKDKENAFKKASDLLLRPTGFNAFKINLCFILPNLATFLNIPMIHRDLSEFILKVIQENIELRDKNNIIRNDFFDLLYELRKQENGLTLDEMCAQAMIFLLAGFETSASSMTFATYELACNEECQDRVREEISTVLKKHDKEITYEALQEMTYLQQIMDETLRKYPILAQLNRECTEEFAIPNTNIVLEKGTSVLISTYGLHHDPEHFPDPEKFDPERFSPENIKNIKPITYLPFGDGPRNCIGLRLGGLQTKIGLVGVLRNHKFSVSSKTKLNFNNKCVTLASNGNVDLIVTRA